MKIIDDNWIYEQSTTNTNRIKKYIEADELKEQMIKYGWKHPDSTVHEFVEDLPAAKVKCTEVECKDCIWHENWGEICYKHGYEDRDKAIVRCKNCKHSIKKDYDVPVSYEYLCILKSTVTHLEEHEADYFCADGKRRDTNG